jgi:ABC-type Mn/Zn transport systems, ATPase component
VALREAVELADVWFAYNGVPVLEGINLAVGPNDFLSIIGPNGGGKTTLLKVIAGLVKPVRGTVKVFGQSPAHAGNLIGYVPQAGHFDRDFPISVFEVVIMGRLGKAGLGRRFGKKDREKAFWALETVALEEFRDRPLGSLSGGQQQRAFIARALVSEPKLLLLDEPTAGVDAPRQVELYELLLELKREMAIILVTHDIGAVSKYVKKLPALTAGCFTIMRRKFGPKNWKLFISVRWT